MHSNSNFSPRLLVAICWAALGVLFSIPAAAHPVYLTGENYTWHYDMLNTLYDNWTSVAATPFQEVIPEYSASFSFPDGGVGSMSVAGSYESQQQSSYDQFSFSARSTVSAEGQMTSSGGAFHGYEAKISQKFYYLEFLVTEEVTFLGNLALTDAFFPTTWPICLLTEPSPCTVFGEVGEVFLSGSVLGPGTYRYWSGSPLSIGAGFAFDGFASVSGGPGTASYSSFTQFIDMRFTATAVPTPSVLMLSLGGFGLMLFARSRSFRNRRGERRIVSES